MTKWVHFGRKKVILASLHHDPFTQTSKNCGFRPAPLKRAVLKGKKYYIYLYTYTIYTYILIYIILPVPYGVPDLPRRKPKGPNQELAKHTTTPGRSTRNLEKPLPKPQPPSEIQRRICHHNCNKDVLSFGGESFGGGYLGVCSVLNKRF